MVNPSKAHTPDPNLRTNSPSKAPIPQTSIPKANHNTRTDSPANNSTAAPTPTHRLRVTAA